MRELAMILNRKRVRRGSIDFDLPEPVIEFDEFGLMKTITRMSRAASPPVLAIKRCTSGQGGPTGSPSCWNSRGPSIPVAMLAPHHPRTAACRSDLPPDLAKPTNVAWEKMQEELAHLSTRGMQTVAKNSAAALLRRKPSPQRRVRTLSSPSSESPVSLKARRCR